MNEKRKEEIDKVRDFVDTPSHFLCLGTTQSGKSHVVKYIIYCLKDRFDYGICISGTADVNEDMSWCPKKYQYDDFDEELIGKIMEKQKDYIQKYGKKKAPQMFIYIDDICGIIGRGHGMKTLEVLFSRGRHYNISVFALVQAATMLSPTIRMNARYFAITMISGKDRDYAWEACSRGYENKKAFHKDLEKNLVDYQVMIYDTHGRNDDYRLLIKAPAVLTYQLKF